MAKTEFFRSNIARGIQEGAMGVDRNIKHAKGQGVINGYAVITRGRLNDQDIRAWEMDDISLNQIVELGNAAKIGLKSRFGHPNMSGEALGTFLGRAKNFRKDGDVVRADLYFDETAFKTPNGDLATYVMDLAQSDPDSFGSSIVFDCEFEYRLEKDGTKKKDEKGNDLPALVRFTKLFASDVVDDPAATSGMFSKFFNSSVELSAKATEFLNKLLCNPEALERVISFLKRYQENRDGIIEEAQESKLKTETSKQEETKMELKELTLEQLKKDRPDLVSALKTETDAVAVSEAVKADRVRGLAIMKADHVEFKGLGMEAIAEKSYEDGLTVDATLASMRGKRLADIAAAGNPAPGADADADKPKLSHMDRAKAYQAEHKCSLIEALKKTAEPRKKK